MNHYENILTAKHGNAALRAGLITLNRPKQLNALNDALMDDLGAALKRYDADDAIGCMSSQTPISRRVNPTLRGA